MTLHKIAPLLLVVLCGLSTKLALANPKWEAVVLNDQGLYYIDAHDITHEGPRVVLWSAIDYKKPQSTAEGESYMSVKSQLSINCKVKMARVMHLTYYAGPMLTGKVISRQGMIHEWMEIDPSSAMHKIARKAC